MNINIETLLPLEKLQQTPDEILKVVDKYGQVVLLKDNAPLYVIMQAQLAVETEKRKADALKGNPIPDPITPTTTSLTLQEAMRIVLSEAEGHQMHASELADAVYERGLYVQKNGEKAKYNQMRARCGHYPEMFEAMKGNFIRLRTEKN